MLFAIAPVAAAAEHLLLSPKRELDADRFAIGITHSPRELVGALAMLDRASDLVAFAGTPATEPLYPVNIFNSEDRLARMFETHPSLEERFLRLRDLETSTEI